jgi:hypothetical protein
MTAVHQVAATLHCSLTANVLNQDAAHGLGGGGKEVSAAIPLLPATFTNEAQVCLVDKGGWLQRGPGISCVSRCAASRRNSS